MRLLAIAALVAIASGCATFHAASPPGAPSKATFVEVDNVRIHYRELGSGEQTVVLIHGFGASLESWRGVHESLARQFRVIALDLPGFGLSGRPDGDYSPPALARIAWKALDQLGVERVSLVGHSWGSSVALTMVLERPQRVERVALYSAYVYEEQVPSFFHWARLPGIGEALFGIWYRERIEDRVALAYHDDRYVTQARVERVEAELSRPGTKAAALAAARGQWYVQLEKRWPTVKQPVLLLWGDDDQITPLRFGQRLARELPNAELEIYPATGHLPMVEARAPSTRDLDAFLRGGETRTVDVELPGTLDMTWSDRVPLRAAADLALLGAELAPRKFAAPRSETALELDGQFRVRGESLYNLDLDRGLDPSGASVFPVPLDGGQRVDGADMRLRTDLALYAPGVGVAVKMRADVLDNLTLGSTPIVGTGAAPTPAASPGQESPEEVLSIERVWGEVLTPGGVVAVGRMGAHWGLGMVAHGGDCDDCDSGDAADRIAVITPLAGHLVALSYDFSSSGPLTQNNDDRAVDLAPSDDVTTVTATILRTRSPAALVRRAAAGRTSIEYGAYVSHRWQADDVPASYLPVAAPMPALDADQLLARDFSATTTGAWVRVLLPNLRLEAEAAYAHARVGQPSLIPGVDLTQEVTSDQMGVAVESEISAGRARGGIDGGFASGDDAPGFGAFPPPGAPQATPGDVDGPQADLPGDTTVDNFRFHPDYRIDRILFREIIGTVTDAAYVRPHASVRVLQLGHAWIEARAALVASWAIEAASTPGGARHLGIELDPSLVFSSRDGFRAALDYAVLFPGAAFDGTAGFGARVAQLVRLRLGYAF